MWKRLKSIDSVRVGEEVVFLFAAESIIFRLEMVRDQPEENLDDGGWETFVSATETRAPSIHANKR
jgi:hypothetical protein